MVPIRYNSVIMKASSRNRIAVVLFVAIILLVIVGFGVYLVLGHQWNRAATSIDVAAGDMGGYTTILFEGTGAPAARNPEDADTEALPTVPLALVSQDYRDKKSDVLVLDAVDEGYYRTARVVERNGRRFGIISFDSNQTASSMRHAIRQLKKRNAQCIIALVPNRKLVNGVDGIDIVIDLKTEPTSSLPKSARKSSSETGGSFGDRQTHVVGTSTVGTVKAVIISPSEIISTRTISSL